MTEEKQQEKRVPRVGKDGTLVYRAPCTALTVVVPAFVVQRLAEGRPLTLSVLWEIVARAKTEGAVLYIAGDPVRAMEAECVRE